LGLKNSSEKDLGFAPDVEKCFGVVRAETAESTKRLAQPVGPIAEEFEKAEVAENL